MRLPEPFFASTQVGLSDIEWACLVLPVGYATICITIHSLENYQMYTVSKAKKGVKYEVLSLDEFWTEKRRKRALRRLEPVPNLEEYLSFMRERMGPELEKIRARRAKAHEQKAKLAGQKHSKTA